MVQKNSINDEVIVVCGPTGSGKSKLAIEICKIFDGEIISADSIAIYKGLDIGAAKPYLSERNEVRHHMIDVVSADKEYSVAEYADNARLIIDDLLSRGKTPVICGGTGYYIDAILYDFSYGNCPKNEDFRKRCNQIVENGGLESLYERLKEVDITTAEKLHSNDAMRIIRALEIFETTGVKKSDILDEKISRYNFYAFSYDFPREVLYERINARVDSMFDKGLLAEVKGLLESGILPSAQSMQGIGYKEVVEGIVNDYSLDEIKEKIKLNTRHYAKRQITWFKRLSGLHYLTNDSIEKTVELIKEIVHG